MLFARLSLALLLATPAWAAEPVITCHDGFSAIEGRPLYDKERRIRERHGRFADLTDEDNSDYVKLAERANRGEATDAKLFLDIENAVLKMLNDKVVQDKDLVTVLTNLHKDMVWKAFSFDPEISKHIVGKYSDFKSVRIAFGEENPALRKLIGKKLFEVNEKYSEYLSGMAAKNGWTDKAKGLAKDMRSWYHAGIGKSPDEAGIAARESREVPGPARLRSFAQSQEALLKAAKDTEVLQRWAANRFEGVDGMLVDAGNGEKVLSAEAIEAIRKVTPREESKEALIEAIQEVMGLRFRVQLKAEEANGLRVYLDAADKFSPGLLLDKRVVIDMEKEAAAAISADFKGQNARNLEETLKALARTEGENISARVRAVRAGEKIATLSLEEKKARFQRVLDRLFPGIRGEFTGDDGLGFLPASAGAEQKKQFGKLWVEEGGRPEDLRLTFEDFHYVDTGKAIPAEERSKLIVAAESIEKKLRAELIRVLPRKDLNDLHIAVSLLGREKGSGRAAVLLSPTRPLPDSLKEKVRAIVEKAGFTVDGVEFSALQ